MIGQTWHDSTDDTQSRRFVLRGLPKLDQVAEILWIDQGYLPFEIADDKFDWAAGGRIRRLLRRNGLCDCDLTQHRGTDLIAIDEMSPIHETLFSRLWEHTDDLTLRKTRYVVGFEDILWYIDSIGELGLFLARAQGSENQVEGLRMPSFLGSVCTREVTDEPGYRSIDFAHRLRRWRRIQLKHPSG